MTKKMLIPTDFSELANHALETALNWARLMDYEPTIIYSSEAFHINDGSPYAELKAQALDHPMKEKIKEISLKKIDDLIAKAAYEKPVKKDVFFGEAHECITRYANENKIDLLFLGHRGRTRLEEFFVGSTTEKVIKTVNCPVVSVQGTEPINPQHLFFLNDFSTQSDKTFAWVKKLAKVFGSKVTMYHIVEPHSAEVLAAQDKDMAISTANELLEKGQLEANKKMESYTKDLTAEGVKTKAVIEITRDYNSTQHMLNYITENKPDLVFMGTHGHSGVKKWLFGSSAELLIRRSPSSLFIIKS